MLELLHHFGRLIIENHPSSPRFGDEQNLEVGKGHIRSRRWKLCSGGVLEVTPLSGRVLPGLCCDIKCGSGADESEKGSSELFLFLHY